MLANAICSICTDVYDSERSVAAMPCGHTFHDECLEKWLRTTRNCPSCRKPLRKTQQPIHRLFFDIDLNLSQQRSPRSIGNADENRKLKAQVTALQSAIQKLKRECEEAQGESASLTCVIAEKDSEISSLNRAQDKLKRRVRDFSGTQHELARVNGELGHLKNVQTIIEGVESDVRRMLEEKAGYTEQQLTYVVLLRQQLDNSKRANDRLKKDIIELREKISLSDRRVQLTDSELEILRLELKQAENKNITLKKKCETLIKSINSPRGVASSLAQRMVNQSPAPQFITPQVKAKTKRTVDVENGAETFTIVETSTPALSSKLTAEASGVVSSPDLFADASSLCLGEGDEVKQTLDFSDEKLEEVENMNPDSNRCLPDSSRSGFGPGKQIKLKPSLKVRKAKLKAIQPIVTGSTAHSSRESSKSQFFRQGYDGLGGQSHMFSRAECAMQFNVFKKPTATKPKPPACSAATKRPWKHLEPFPASVSDDDVIVLD